MSSFGSFATSIALAAVQSTEEGLTFGEILANVPHDASAFVVYALVLGTTFAIWRYGRDSEPRGE